MRGQETLETPHEHRQHFIDIDDQQGGQRVDRSMMEIAWDRRQSQVTPQGG
jgi:hypothetical protein